MTPYLLALGLWTLGWALAARWEWRRIDRRVAAFRKEMANRFPEPWEG